MGGLRCVCVCVGGGGGGGGWWVGEGMGRREGWDVERSGGRHE